MAIKPFVSCDHPALLKPAKQVDKINDPLVQQAIADLKDTLTLQQPGRGVGLAAVQIGIPLAIFVIGIPEERAKLQGMEEGYPLTTYINPKISAENPSELVADREACFSFPGFAGKQVKRLHKIHFQALDEAGNPVDLAAEGFLARVLQHETDHCNGFAWLHRLDVDLKQILAWAEKSQQSEFDLPNEIELLAEEKYPQEFCQRDYPALIHWLKVQLQTANRNL